MLLASGPDLDTIEATGIPSFKFGVSGAQLPARVISAVLPYVFGAAALILLVYLVTAGISMMTSRGDPKAMQGAQAKITYAIVGFVIVFFAWIFVSIIGKIFGINIFGSVFK
jgi:hypothetical protein